MPAPTMTRMPPALSWANPASMAARCPEHSSTTRTARRRHALGLPWTGRPRGRTGPRWRTRPARPRAAPSLVGLHHRDVRDVHGAQRRDAQRADGAGAEDHHAVARCHARTGDAVEGHRQRLRQCGVAGGQAFGEPQDTGGAAQDVFREGAVGVFGGHAGAVLALRRLALMAASARPTTRGGATDDPLPDRPPGDLVTHGGDRAAPLVACHGTGREPPAVAQLVDVGSTDTTGVHTHDELVGPGPGHRALLDGDDARRLVDSRLHDLGEGAHGR